MGTPRTSSVAVRHPAGGSVFSRTKWPLRALSILVAVLFALLLVLATILLIRSGLFSTRKLSDEQTKALWTFLGVLLAAVASLIAAALTEQNNLRSAAMAKEAQDRLVVDSIAKLLELVPTDTPGGAQARVAGSIVSLMQLEAGPVAVRILGELWKAKLVDPDTATWLIEQILANRARPENSDEMVEQAVSLLVINAGAVVTNEPTYAYSWPSSLDGQWIGDLSPIAKYNVLLAACRVLSSRGYGFWEDSGGLAPITDMLLAALDDDEGEPKDVAALILNTLLENDEENTFDFDDSDDLRARVATAASSVSVNPLAAGLLEELAAALNDPSREQRSSTSWVSSLSIEK